MSEHSWIDPDLSQRRAPVDDSNVVPERFRQGRESLSVLRNITVRESKRPKARSSDQDYKRRYSVSPGTLGPLLRNQRSGNNSAHGMGNYSSSHDDGDGYEEDVGTRSAPKPPGSGLKPPSHHSGGGTAISGGGTYVVNLSFEGQLTRHEVTPTTRVSQLREDAAGIYGLMQQHLVLVLFGMNPHTLVMENRLCDPPMVGPGATVLIFNVRGMARNDHPPFLPPRQQNYDQQSIHAMPAQAMVTPGGPKFLGQFKLTKFDGSSRGWKQWDKSFVRYLSIHQLDHVIEETFLDELPLSPLDFSCQ
jgi:hypothetical protein